MKKSRQSPEINSSSMADIAFLLLIFFLVTTQFASDKGILIQLPPKIEDQEREEINIPDYEILTILINSSDKLLVEGDRMDEVSDLVQTVKDHVLNNGQNPEYSSKPEKAIVSIKADRGTTYEMYLSVLDAVDQAYNEIYAEKLGITAAEFLALDRVKSERDKAMYDRAKEGLPKQVSIAEPTDIGG